VAVLSYRIWRTRYGADPAILGRQVRLNSAPFTVIGVAQEDFTGTSAQYDLWAPLASKPAVNPEARTELMGAQWCCYMVARLAPGATREQARAELLGLYRQFRTGIGREPNDITLRGSRYLDRGGDKMGFYLVFAVLAAACGAVLLVACANVANLLLARGAARRHEFAVRVSIGAGRARIVRQLLTESLLLAVLGSGLGLPLAYLLPGLFAGQSTAVNWGPDIGVLGAMIALAIVSALLFGLAPAVRATGAGIHESMKQGARSSSARFPLRSLLLGGQAAISVTLLVGAALLIRGLSAARSLDYGFKIGGIATITVQLPATAYDPARLRAFYDDVVQEMKPYGAVGVGSSPLDAPRLPIALTDEKTSEIRLAKHIAANAGYLDVLGIAIAAGRNLNPADRQNRRILVNEAMARSYWPSQIPVGKAIFNGGERYEIVGVVRDSRLSGPGAGVEPAYFSHSDAGLLFVPSSLAGAAARVVNHLDPRARLTLAPLSDSLDRLLAPASRAALFAEMLGVLALLLATVGVYGVMSYSVEQRRREIGIRMALGAHPREILKLALLRHTRPLVCGLAVGLAASVAASQVLVSLLYGLTPVDPLAYGAALIVMLAAGAVASAVPAFRACRIDPVETLRYD
jgi:predicted permease